MKTSEQRPVIFYIKKLGRPVFSTIELSALSGKSNSTVTQALNYLKRQGIIFKIYHGLWAEAGSNISAYMVVPFLFPRNRAYVSFISALHLYGIVEQIPQAITLASLTHSRIIKTSIGSYIVHRIAPSFFNGFMWYKNRGDFLVAEPEKALVDSLYLSARKKKQYRYFPELNFPKTFSFKRAEAWVKKINDIKIKKFVQEKLYQINTVKNRKER